MDGAIGPFVTLALDRTRPLTAARRFELTGLRSIVIGRAADDRVVRDDGAASLRVGVADPAMSERHVVLERGPIGWEIADAGSKNGTLVDGAKLTRQAVHDGAVIEAGRCFFVFRAATPTDPGAPVTTIDDLAGRPDGLVTFHPALERRLAVVERIAGSRLQVLVLGETGTGKDVLARAIHAASGRTGELVAINCGAIPATLLESVLFGHRRGAFSGATDDRPGVIRSAHQGTLFLDEVGELSPAGQVALLRVLQEGEVVPVGDTRAIPVDVRIVAATLRDLRLAAAAGTFRDDLLARLTGYVVETVPLRARREDVGLLLARLVAAGRLAWPPGVTLSRAAAQLLLQHPWPHNVRELAHAVASALVIVGERGEIQPQHLAGALGGAAPSEPGERSTDGAGTPPSAIDATLPPADRLRALMALYHGNLSAVARALQTSRTQVARLLERHGIDRDGFK